MSSTLQNGRASVAGSRSEHLLGVRTNDAVWTRLAAAAARPEGAQALLYDAQGSPIAQSGTLDDAEDAYDAAESVPLAGWQARKAAGLSPS